MSRLLDNSEARNIRDNLFARNLYDPDNEYSIDNKQITDTINTIVGVLKPFKSFDITNTVIGRLVGVNTPIAQIGLEMLGDQLGKTVASNASAEYLPSITFRNLFDGDPNSKFFMRKIDFAITRRESQTTMGKLIESITGSYRPKSPFTPYSNVGDFIRNTGKGQLQFLYANINRNLP